MLHNYSFTESGGRRFVLFVRNTVCGGLLVITVLFAGCDGRMVEQRANAIRERNAQNDRESSAITMNTPIITVGGHHGSIFEGELPVTFCFVPQECISTDVDGAHVNEIEYVRSGWDLRNMRLSDLADGQHLFPKSFCPVMNLDTESVRHFLDRIQFLCRACAGLGEDRWA